MTVSEFDTNPAWTEVTIDLTPYVGGNVYIRFWFDTVDSVANGFEGWLIDDVTLLAAPTIDTTPPPAPSTPDLVAGSDTGSSNTDNITSDNSPTFTGTAEANSTVEVFDGITAIGTTTASATGGWTFTPTIVLLDGPYSITATATDAADNTSDPSVALSMTIDTTAPATPSTPDLDPGSDTGSSNTDNITSDNTPTFTGTAEADTTVTVYSDGVEVGSGTALVGAYSITTGPLTDGVHSITATATDAAGNTSSASGSQSVTIDTVAPASSITINGGASYTNSTLVV